MSTTNFPFGEIQGKLILQRTCSRITKGKSKVDREKKKPGYVFCVQKSQIVWTARTVDIVNSCTLTWGRISVVEHSTADREDPCSNLSAPLFHVFSKSPHKIILWIWEFHRTITLYNMLLPAVTFINCIKCAGKLGANLAEIAFAAAILTIQPFVPNWEGIICSKVCKGFQAGFSL